MPFFARTILLRLALLLGAYGVTRAFFLIWNWDLFSSVPSGQIAMAFVHGLRFDLSAILLTNALLIPLWLLPSALQTKRWLARVELALFGLINLVALAVNVIDAEYYKFIGKRNSYDLLFLQDDIRRQLPTLLASYWYMTLVFALIFALFWWITPRFHLDARERAKSLGFWGWRFAAIALTVLGIRGGFQFKPLHPMHAYFSTRHELGLLALNTPFNLMRSKPRQEIHRERYFATDQEAITRLRSMNDLSRPPLGVAKRWNVVVLVLESFSLEYVGAANNGKGYTPFLDELSRDPKAFFFPRNFANARRSIEGLPAVLCGLPAMMAEPVITSDFANNRLDCLPKVLGQRGYSTYFLHGAHNGSMHFDTFSRIAGFETFVGLNEYPKDNPADLDEYWGVLDEPMLQYAAKLLDEAPKPALLSVFTLSSHNPYYIPPQHRGKFPKGTLEIHESIGYTDYSLRQFFKTASERDWFNNTIFVITADHTQKTDQPAYHNLIGAWRVPLFFYIPGLKEGAVRASSERITQHADVIPSVMDLLGEEIPERLLAGQSVFDEARQGRAYNYTHYSYWYITPDRLVDFARQGETRAYTHSTTWDLQEVPLNHSGVPDALLDIKAVVHYLNEGLVGNSLHRWRSAQ